MARGWALIGVLKSLATFNVRPAMIAGTSMGALVGGAFASDQLPTLEAWARGLKTFSFWRHVGLSRKPGLFDSAGLGRQMRAHLGQVQIQDLPIPFAAIATDLATGQEVWISEGDLVEAVRASFAVPGFFAPMRIEGRPLADGFLTNPVPITATRALGAELVISVTLHTDQQLGDPLAKARSPAGSTMGSLASAFQILQQRLSRMRLAADPPDVHIAVPCQHIGVLDFHRADELIALGMEAAYMAAPRIEAAVRAMQAAKAEHLKAVHKHT
jgi:NTE family protein